MVKRLSASNFRNLGEIEIDPGLGINVISGPNGAGKTNLIDAIYYGLSGRSARSLTDRQLTSLNSDHLRVEVSVTGRDQDHHFEIGRSDGEKVMYLDGARQDRFVPGPTRPLLGVFLPERLELVKGQPGTRRAHLDQVVKALWPTRDSDRSDYLRTLSQRNALLSRRSRDQLSAWSDQLAKAALKVTKNRREAVSALAQKVKEYADQLGLDGDLVLSYRPSLDVDSTEAAAALINEKIELDLERGYTTTGPHRDDLTFQRSGHDLRRYGSQGEQRLAVLALLLAQREVLARHQDTPLVLLLDDVLSELDELHRARLMDALADGSQCFITTTELEEVPTKHPFSSFTLASGSIG